MHDRMISRFFCQSDPRIDHLVFPISQAWWSRFYEYAWASSFAEPNDTVLDAACGIPHHLKFYLAAHCSEVYACDLDPKILAPEAILNEIVTEFGTEATKEVPGCLQRIHLAQADISKLPYPSKKFDKIYCISVLEHLEPEVIHLALAEFQRTLSDQGYVILTFDYPTLNLDRFKVQITEAGFEFCGPTCFDLPDNALYNDLYDLYCFRAVLKKASI